METNIKITASQKDCDRLQGEIMFPPITHGIAVSLRWDAYSVKPRERERKREIMMDESVVINYSML